MSLHTKLLSSSLSVHGFDLISLVYPVCRSPVQTTLLSHVLDYCACFLIKIFPAKVPIICSSLSVTEYYANKMEAAVQQGHAVFCLPAFDSVHFPQLFPMGIPAPFEGFESPLVGFFLQCEPYFSSLVDPKPEEKQWLGFTLSQFTNSARQWAELLGTTGVSRLRSMAELVGILKVCLKQILSWIYRAFWGEPA